MMNIPQPERLSRILAVRPVVMGILNATPDSFSDGLPGATAEDFIAKALKLLDEGADILDVGGESTRPGAEAVSETEELGRVLPVIEGVLQRRPETLLSLDTRKLAVAKAHDHLPLAALNDTSGLQDDSLPLLAGRRGWHYVYMHSRGTPSAMTGLTDYAGGVPHGVIAEARSALTRLREMGLQPARVIVDPGFGFAKTPEQCSVMMENLDAWARLRAEFSPRDETAFTLMIGISRKRFLQLYTGENRPGERDDISAKLAAEAVRGGFRIVRTHRPALTRRHLGI